MNTEINVRSLSAKYKAETKVKGPRKHVLTDLKYMLKRGQLKRRCKATMENAIAIKVEVRGYSFID